MNKRLDEAFPRAFGDYILLDHAESGGMATVFRAITRDNIGRLVVIKKIHSHLSSQNEYRRMFIDEIKITAGLSHPNIVHVNSYGNNGDYLELEYVHGMTLEEIWTQTRLRNEFIPIPIVLYIAHEVAKGLKYAHYLKDEITGENLNIVHRDISPQNIMVGFNGTVKILDFGIARIANRLETTQEGQIKGKPFYMSPEQFLEPSKVNQRSDIFSLGVVLWNLLTNHKLLVATSHEAYFSKLKEFSVDNPQVHNKEISDHLNSLVMKALQLTPEDRFQNIELLRTALFEEANQKDQTFSLASKTKNWLSEVFAEDIQGEKEQIAELLSRAKIFYLQNNTDKTETIVQTLSDSQLRKGRKKHVLNLLAAVVVAGIITTTSILALLPSFKETDTVSRTPASVSHKPLEDLRILIDQKNWKKSLSFADKVEPKDRSKAWKNLVTEASLGHLKNTKTVFLYKTNLEDILELGNQFPFLMESKDFLVERDSLAIEVYRKCLMQKKPLCLDQLYALINQAPFKVRDTLSLAEITTIHYIHRAALPLYSRAVEKGNLADICIMPRLKSSIENGLNVPGESGKLAADIQKKCQSHTK